MESHLTTRARRKVVLRPFLILVCLVLLHSIPSSSFQFQCTKDYLCELFNWDPQKEGTFVLNHIPDNYNNMYLRNMRATHVNSEIFEPFECRRPMNMSKIFLEIEKSSIRSFKLKDRSHFSLIILRGTLLRSIVFGVNCNLREFKVARSRLQQLPPTLSNLKSLVHLEITHSLVQAVNLNAIGRLPNLELLNLSNNRIHSLYYTADIELFPCLLYFYMQNNQLRSINFNLFDTMTSIIDIDLKNNRLTSVSGALVSNSVRSLELTNNQLTSMDCCTWRSTSLYRFDAASNMLEALPRCLEQTLTNVSLIILANNRLQLDEMEKFRSFMQLEVLDLSQNMLSHVTLTEDTLPPNLHSLNLSNNRLQRIAIPSTPTGTQLSVDVSNNCIKNFDLDDVSDDLLQLLMFNNPVDCTLQYDVPSNVDGNKSNVICIYTKRECESVE